MRQTGIGVIGDVPWGSHFCQFYNDRQDLIDILVPYFTAGLEHNEFCMWITSEPLNVAEARQAMVEAVPDFDDHVRRGQILFLDYRDWYTLGGKFDSDRVLRGWVDALSEAKSNGFDGLRLSGNTFWLEASGWRDFTDYEAAIDGVIAQYDMLALCTYSLARCGAPEIMDVVSNHAFALIRRSGTWQVIESAERRKFEASLQASEERYRSLFNGMTEGFALHEIICDEAGRPCDYRFLDVNPTFERMTGLARQDVVGRTMKDVLPGEDPVWIERFGQVAITGEPVTFENYAPVLQRHYEVFAYRPAARQFAVVFLDITKRKRVEEELAEANRLKDEFLATLSHELRTPLNAILGWSDMLRRGRLDPLATSRAIETIQRNARAQAQLVGDVLDVSRIVAGKLRLNVQQVDVAAILQSSLDVVRPAADGRMIALDAVGSATPALAMGDPDRLQQILWNLLSNAIKFTPPGGQVHVRLDRVDSQIQIAVTDTGIGIEPAFLPFVFDRFRQHDSSSSREHGGLGLGLAIVRHLVELHGGTVEVTSEGPGRGATFTLRLPVRAIANSGAGYERPSDAGADAIEARRVAIGTGLAGVTVLAVDDEADARDLIRAALEDFGAVVRVAASAAAAIEALDEAVPDVLLADIGMPGEDGYALIAHVRASADSSRARVAAIALTAYGRADDQVRALQSGFDRHLAKPVLPDDLADAIASVLRLGHASL